MIIEQIRTIIENNNIVSFKLYSLNYIVEKLNNNIYVIYSTTSPKTKRYFDSFDDLITKYRIFGENISSNESRIKNIK